MNYSLNEEFVSSIRKQIPQRQSVVDVIMDILSIGKVAVYRRIRSEVPFTFDEAVRICRFLDFSIDNIISSDNVNTIKWPEADKNGNYSVSDFINQHYQYLESVLEMLRKTRNAKKIILRVASNILPGFFILPYKNLSNFRLYKYSYLRSQNIIQGEPFSKMEKPAKMVEFDKQYFDQFIQIPRIIMILDADAIKSMIYDIQYFYEQQLISKEEVHLLKFELIDLLSHLEKMAATGIYNEHLGTEITLYISNVDLESTLSHFEADDYEVCALMTFFVNQLTFQNSVVCRKYKMWIESLKRYSMLITQSGEKQRFDFFNKQRNLIAQLD